MCTRSHPQVPSFLEFSHYGIIEEIVADWALTHSQP
jgi:hypothetical protein